MAIECDGYSCALVANRGSIESPRPLPPTRRIVRTNHDMLNFARAGPRLLKLVRVGPLHTAHTCPGGPLSAYILYFRPSDLSSAAVALAQLSSVTVVAAACACGGSLVRIGCGAGQR